MNKIKGIVLYNIERDGNLNGVYTNNHPDMNSRIFTETARLVDDTLVVNGTEIREYECFYFDAVSGRVDCNLTFRINNGIISAAWFLLDENEPIFKGEGFQMNERQIAISYWSV